MTLVGRDEQLKSFVRRLAAAGGGRGGALGLPGDPGLGKTRLLGAAGDLAREAGLTFRLEQAGGRSGWPGELPQVLLLDDLHRAPRDQAEGIERLLAGAAGAGTLIILTYRPRQLAPAFAAVLSRAQARGHLSVEPVEPLNRQDARLLIGDRADADDLYAQSGGNPLYLQLLAAEHNVAPELVGAILDEVPGDHVEATQAAAVLGSSFVLDLLAAVCPCGRAGALAALDALTAADLLRSQAATPDLTFRHPVVRQVIYHTTEMSLRLRTHRKAEAWLRTHGATALQRAPHLAPIASRCIPWHATTLLDAARQLIATEPGTAVAWLQVAQSLLTDDHPAWSQTQVLLGRAHLLGGRLDDSRQTLHRLLPRLATLDSEVVAAATVYSSHVERLRDRFPEAGAMVRAGLSHGASTASMHAELADLALDTGAFRLGVGHATRAAILARRQGNSAQEVTALALAALSAINREDAATGTRMVSTAAHLVDAASDSVLLEDLQCLYQLGLAQTMLEDYTAAERHIDRGVALARRAKQLHLLPLLLKSQGDLRLRFGRLSEAVATLDEACEYARRYQLTSNEHLSAITGATALWWRDGADMTGMAARTVRQCEALPGVWAVIVRFDAADLILLAGDPEHATRLFLAAGGGPQLTTVAPWRRIRPWERLTAAAVGTGDLTAARLYAELARAAVRRRPSPVRAAYADRAYAQVCLADKDFEGALAAGQRAAKTFAAHGLRIDTAMAYLCCAAAARAAGFTETAKELGDKVQDLATGCGSQRLAHEVTQLRNGHARTPAVPSSVLAALSPRELEVATLAATGLTSAQIAQKLFVSARTVESHLARVYRKTAVSTRVSLARLMLGAPGRDDPDFA